MDDVTKEEIIKEAIENAKKDNKKKKAAKTPETEVKPEETQETEAEKESAEDSTGKEQGGEAEEKESSQNSGQPEQARESDSKEPENDSGKEDKKGFFQKKNKADKYKEQISELEDKVKRQLAEFENFRNRTEKEKSQMYDMGARNVLEKILPVIDNFERGLATVPQEASGGAFAEGMNMIYKQLLTELEKLGVTPIEAVGKEFDPNLHNAVMQVESEEYESGFIAQEMQKGYMYRDTVLRHSMVGVVP